MKNEGNVRNWRKDLGLSQRELAKVLNDKINADIPVDSPKYFTIYQPDINKVENGTASSFITSKVLGAIYRYMGVAEGTFGEHGGDALEGEAQKSLSAYLQEGIQLRDRIIQCYEQNMKLMEEKELLANRVLELEAALESYQTRIETLEKQLGK